MYLSARTSPVPQRSARPTALIGALLLLLATTIALASPSAAAQAAPATPAGRVATVSAVVGTAAPAASVTSLRVSGTTTTVTVQRVYRRGQVRWINHVLSTRLVDLDGCQAEKSRTQWNGRTYRAVVRTICVAGPAKAENAAAKLRGDRPWYHVDVDRVPLVGFGFLVDLPEGNDRAVPAALATLPTGPFTFAEGDDLSLTYVGQGVSQAQLDNAVAAFASALGVPVSKVEVTPLGG